jgi:hypothetical protein
MFFERDTGKGFDIYWIDANIINELKRHAGKEKHSMEMDSLKK